VDISTINTLFPPFTPSFLGRRATSLAVAGEAAGAGGEILGIFLW